MSVKFIIKDKNVVAVATHNEKEDEIGNISIGVSEETLMLFKRDMCSLYDLVLRLNHEQGSISEPVQDYESSQYTDVVQTSATEPEDREEPEVSADDHQSVVQVTTKPEAKAVPPLPFNNDAVISSQKFLESLEALPKYLVGCLFGKKYEVLGLRLHDAAGTRKTPFFQVELTSVNKSSKYDGDLGKSVKILADRIESTYAMSIDCREHLDVVLGYMCTVLVNLGFQSFSLRQPSWLEYLKRIMTKSDYSKVVTLVDADQEKSSGKPKGLVPPYKEINSLSKDLRDLLLGPRLKGASSIRRVRNSEIVTDAFLFRSVEDKSRIARSVANPINSTAKAMADKITSVYKNENVRDLLVVIKWMLRVLLTQPAPKLGKPSPEVIWSKLLEQESEVAGEVEPQETKVGFTEPALYEKEIKEHMVGNMASKSWPWLFDTNGLFHYMQFAVENGKPGILYLARGKKKGSRNFVPVEPTYSSIRSAVEKLRLLGIAHVGIDEDLKVKSIVDDCFELFTEALLRELDVQENASVSKALNKNNYLNFGACMEPDDILEQLTYPTGRLRVAMVAAGADGIFWYVRADDKGVGYRVKPKRIRYDPKKRDEQVEEIAGIIVSKTSIDPGSSIADQIKSVLRVEANRVYSGLV